MQNAKCRIMVNYNKKGCRNSFGWTPVVNSALKTNCIGIALSSVLECEQSPLAQSQFL